MGEVCEDLDASIGTIAPKGKDGHVVTELVLRASLQFARMEAQHFRLMAERPDRTCRCSSCETAPAVADSPFSLGENAPLCPDCWSMAVSGDGRRLVAVLADIDGVRCRRCGCSWHFPCHHEEPGVTCSWAEPDLCSACADGTNEAVGLTGRRGEPAPTPLSRIILDAMCDGAGVHGDAASMDDSGKVRTARDVRRKEAHAVARRIEAIILAAILDPPAVPGPGSIRPFGQMPFQPG